MQVLDFGSNPTTVHIFGGNAGLSFADVGLCPSRKILRSAQNNWMNGKVVTF